VSDQVKASTEPSNTLLGLLAGGGLSTRMQRLIYFQYTASALTRIAKVRYQQARSRISYTLTVDGGDPLYPDIHAWLLNLLPASKQRSLIVESSDRRDDSPVSVDDRPKPAAIRFLFDGEREQEVVIAGHKVKVAVNMERGRDQRREFKIAFVCYGLPARDAVVDLLKQIALSRTDQERLPRLYLATRWGDWSRRDDLAARDPASVVLRAGVMKTLLDDLAMFRTHEADYIRLGMPFHRGYLFYGPPGSGKSSVARALASRFGMDMYYLPLGDLSDDSNLTQMIARIPAGSALLLEDIDTFGIARKRDEAGEHTTGTMLDPGASLSGLLNALDGMVTPHGLVTMMTTNNRSVLDEGLVRQFRVNIDQEIGYIDDDQLRGLVATFTGLKPWNTDRVIIAAGAEVTSAQVLGAIMANLDNVDEAIVQIERMVS
jgi:hypothetical protein